MTRSIALIGYGAIGQAVCAAAAAEALPVRQVLVRPGTAETVSLNLPRGVVAIESLDALRDDITLVIECAGHQAVRAQGTAILDRGLDLALLSAGALAVDALHQSLTRAARASGARVRVLSGAIGGIDALAAAGSELTDVRYIARKPPASWRGTPAEAAVDLAQITSPTPVFEGAARAAALSFPKNANVVATVALAGIGFERTQVVLMADPDAAGNSHEIAASGGGYSFTYKTTGAALPSNPKTSALTAQSVLRALRNETPGLII